MNTPLINALQALVDKYEANDHRDVKNSKGFMRDLALAYMKHDKERLLELYSDAHIRLENQLEKRAQNGKDFDQVFEFYFPSLSGELYNALWDDFVDYWDEQLKPANRNQSIVRIGDYYYDKDQCRVVGVAENPA
jgi:ketosteroid isomerase-like protein